MGKRKLITIFFDLEGVWGNPDIDTQALETNIKVIRQILDRDGIRAVFNTTGKVIEEVPDLVKELHKDNHEISVHGYLHENFQELNMQEASEVLDRVEELIQKVAGIKPMGIRMPWLAYDISVYPALKKRGYIWASNLCQYSTAESVDKPHNLQDAFYKMRILRKFILKFKERFVLYQKGPFVRSGLWEFPLLSTPDTQLFKEVYPCQKTSGATLDYAYNVLKSQYQTSGEYFNLNFHPWLIASANRIELLDKILNYIKKRNEGIFKLPSEIVRK